MVGGFAMVLLQCATCLAVVLGMVYPSCTTNDHCGTAGTYCSVGVCEECGWLTDMPLQVDPATNLASNTGIDPGNAMDGLPAGADNWSGDFNNTAAAAWCAGEPVCGYAWEGAQLLCRTAYSDGNSTHIMWDRSNGEVYCAGERFTSSNGRAFCDASDCCHWGDGACHSAVGAGACPSGGGSGDVRHPTANWCNACGGDGHPIIDTGGKVGTGQVDTTMWFEDITVNNVAAMGPFDWLALMLASVVTATAVVAELRDIKLCLLALDRADPPLPVGWRLALRGLAIVRRYTFLPALVTAVPAVVVFQGGDALSILFNTVAVLFLTEVE